MQGKAFIPLLLPPPHPLASFTLNKRKSSRLCSCKKHLTCVRGRSGFKGKSEWEKGKGKRDWFTRTFLLLPGKTWWSNYKSAPLHHSRVISSLPQTSAAEGWIHFFPRTQHWCRASPIDRPPSTQKWIVMIVSLDGFSELVPCLKFASNMFFGSILCRHFLFTFLLRSPFNKLNFC